MALSEEQELKIAGILDLTYIEVHEKLTWVGDKFTNASQAEAELQLERWDAVGGKFTRIRANAENFGAEINPEDAKLDIKKRLAKLLYFTELTFSSGNWGVGGRG